MNQIIGDSLISETKKTLIEQEIGMLDVEIQELRSSVEWLIEKLRPVCQESTLDSCGENGAEGLTASPSPLRQKIMESRRQLGRISKLLSDVRFTIEI